MFDLEHYPQELIEGLKRALKSQNFPHTLLIHGPKGIGKKDLALALSVALICEKGGALDYCSCAACKRALDGSHPDVKFIANEEGESIKVDDIRDCINWIRLRPFEGEKKALILEGVENLGEEALNAFLKMLEEPPDSTYLILLTEAPTRLKGTLLSRCFQIGLRPVATRTLKDGLLKKGIAADEAHYVSLISRGVWKEAEERISEKSFLEDDQRLGVLLSHHSYEVMEEYLGRGREKKTQEEKRNVAEELLQITETFLRDVLIYKTAPEPDRIEELFYFKHRRDWIERKAEEESEESVYQKIAELESLRRRLDHNANPRLALLAISETLGKPVLEVEHV